MKKGHRLRAPSSDGGLLAVPPLSEVAGQFARTKDRLAGWDHDFQGRRAGVLRAMVHRQVMGAACAFLRRHGLEAPETGPCSGGDPTLVTPLVVTGHQPELFHPGVWVKNFATAAIAKAHGGLGLNFIVDNDLPKSASIRVPTVDKGRIHTVRVEFDQWKGEMPYEDWEVHDEGLFASFGDRVRRVLGGAVADPIIDDFWPRALRQTAAERTLGMRIAVARRELESQWGFSNLEIPLSEVCQTEGFFWFTSHLLAHLARFQQIHNEALVDYRQIYGIRSKHHPVAALGTQGEWREAPFWVWRQGQPRRRAPPGSSSTPDHAPAHRRRGRSADRIAPGARPRGLLRRGTPPGTQLPEDPAPYQGADNHHVLSLPAWRSFHSWNRRGQVRRAG